MHGCKKEPVALVLLWLLGVSAAGYLYKMVEEIKRCRPEVKASKLVIQLRSCGHLKICMVSDHLGVYVDVFCWQLLADTYSKKN